ncbi:carboxymuconolactone decarboxylase family protein [Georgenia halophila]|uniref:carboxymuconolactone decarboxylase family protein n=1 Tax=Georgenia halophila TaxID=620889 RepID=UPI0031EF2FF8
MSATQDPQEYIDQMALKRGYVLDYHKVMAKHDFEVLQAANELVNAAYLNERTLDRKTKELIFIATQTILRAPKTQIQSHIRIALDVGATAQEILEAIETTLPEAGVIVFNAGFEAWREVVEADGIEPTVDVYNASE